MNKTQKGREVLNSCVARADKFVSGATGRARRMLEDDFVDEKNKTEIRFFIKGVDDNYNELRRLILLLGDSDPSFALDMLIPLVLLFGHAQLIGSDTLVSDTSRGILRIEQGMLAQSAKSAQDKLKEQRLFDAIKLATRPYEKVKISEEFARLIRPEVLRRLGVKEGKSGPQWPSPSTIKGGLRKPKKSGRI